MAKRRQSESDGSDVFQVANTQVAQEQSRKFGIQMLIGGLICAALPFVGLTVKGLPPEGCFIVGGILAVIGLIALLTSLSTKANSIAIDGTKLAMYAVIGFFGLILVGGVGALLVVFVGPALFAPKPPAAPVFNAPVAPVAVVPGAVPPAVAATTPIPDPALKVQQAEQFLAEHRAKAAKHKQEVDQMIADARARADTRLVPPPSVVANTPTTTPNLPAPVTNPSPANPRLAVLKTAPPSMLDSLVSEFLSSSNPEDLPTALQFLAEIQPAEKHEQIALKLVQLLQAADTKPDVRNAVARLMGKWGVPTAYPELLIWAKSAPPEARDAARLALQGLRTANPTATQLPPPEQEALELGLAWLDGNAFPGLNDFLQVLKDAKPKRTSNELTLAALPYLDAKFGAKANVIVLGILGRWGTGKAIDPIQKRYESETSAPIKKFADSTVDLLKKRLEAVKKTKTSAPQP